MRKRGGKRGQVAIWIILAVVLAASVILFFAIRKGPLLSAKQEFEPGQYISKCTDESVNEAVDKMLPQGGFLEPRDFKIYNDTKIEYLCKSNGYYVPCINYHPMLMKEIISQIEDYTRPKIELCFNDIKAEAEKKNKAVEIGDMNFTISLAPGRIYAKIARKVVITEGESKRIIEKFDAEILNPVYGLADVAINIANHEAKYCYFEYVGYMAFDKNVDIRKFTMSDSTSIYTIKDKLSGKIMNIATKSCSIPPGI